MPRFISRFALMPVILLWALCGPMLTGQEVDRKESADRVQDGCDQIVVFDDLRVVVDDVTTLLGDLGYGGFSTFIKEYIRTEPDSGFSYEQGAIIYSRKFFSGASIVQFSIDDRDQLRDSLDAPQDHELNRMAGWFDIGTAGLLPILDWDAEVAIIDGDRLLSCVDGEQERAELILDAPRLAERLDPPARKILNESGITVIGQGESLDLDNVVDVESIVRDAAGGLTEAENQWLAEFADVASSAQLAMLGLKYQNQTLELRCRALIEDMKSFDGLFELARSDRDWQPDLGLPVERLVVAGTIQMEAFRSSAGARVVPQSLLQEFGRSDQLRFLQGNMLRVLMELAGDSWNEISAGRIALYETKSSDEAGQLAIVGVVDCDEPGIVLGELQRLSKLTRPAEDPEVRRQVDEEIARLVTELQSDDINLAARAETRLVLAGRRAVSAVERLQQSTSDQKILRRTERVLGKLQTGKAANARQVADPRFWTTLNPGLQLVESTGSIRGFAEHQVKITPDPSKTPEEVADAVAAMAGLFGPEWDTIRFVQVDDHFVFMIGSDDDLLQQTVANVGQGARLLTKQFENVGQGDKSGQLQVFVNTRRALELLGSTTWLPKPPAGALAATEDQICWVGLGFEHNAVRVDALIPVQQVIPFLSAGFF